MSTVRLLLALAAANSWELTSADIPTAYLQSWLHDVVVYCSWPPGFEQFQPGTILRCHRSLYGLPQSAHEWGTELREALMEFGFKRCWSDRQLYVWDTPRGILLVCCWVDDLLCATSSSEMRREFMVFMQRFRITDLGPLRRGLGADIYQDLDAGTVTFSLTGYIRDTGRRLQIPQKHVDIPAPRGSAAACRKSTPPSTAAALTELVELYLVLSGIITFIASTSRPDIAWHAYFISTATANPTEEYYNFAIRVFQYLVTTADLALTYRRSEGFTSGMLFTPGEHVSAQPHMLADASLVSPRSISSWCFMVCGAAVFWKVMAQFSPALSSGEAEFYALTSAVATAVHMRQLTMEMSYEWLSPMLIFSDGRAARLMIQNGNSTPNVRHVDLKWWFAHYHVELGHVSVHPVRGTKNPVNALTKCIAGNEFFASRSYLLGTAAFSAASAAMLASYRRVRFDTRHYAASLLACAWRRHRLST